MYSPIHRGARIANVSSCNQCTVQLQRSRGMSVPCFLVAVLTICSVLLSWNSQAQAQTFPPPGESSTPLWEQNFSALTVGAAWVDVNGQKIQAHPTNALIEVCPSTPPGTTSKNCYKVIYNHTGGPSGVLKQPPSDPVFATPIPGSPDCGPSGTATTGLPCIGWVPADATTTNTSLKTELRVTRHYFWILVSRIASLRVHQLVDTTVA